MLSQPYFAKPLPTGGGFFCAGPGHQNKEGGPSPRRCSIPAKLSEVDIFRMAFDVLLDFLLMYEIQWLIYF
ncbi:hypothetical protein, partial [Vibrio sp. V36_P2S2PM302]|uniref:hypothetical protein n=1 Tax=Vibrio sp. V36_P2S2PM302 TaxID=1938687 RepID=UPI001F27562B